MLLASQLTGRGTVPKFRRYLVGKTGASCLLLSGQPRFHIHRTADGDTVHFYEEEIDGVTFGLVVVQMSTSHPLPKAETILLNYLTRIRKPFGIACNAGTETERRADAVSLCDYWRHENGSDWKVRGCTNGRLLSVAYVKNVGDAAVSDHDAFLNGLRF